MSSTDAAESMSLRLFEDAIFVDTIGDDTAGKPMLGAGGGWGFIGCLENSLMHGLVESELIGFRFFKDSCDGRFVWFAVRTEFSCDLQLSVDVE